MAARADCKGGFTIAPPLRAGNLTGCYGRFEVVFEGGYFWIMEVELLLLVDALSTKFGSSPTTLSAGAGVNVYRELSFSPLSVKSVDCLF